MLVATLLSLVLCASADELVQVQVLWRHGDRTPLECYPTDPYRSYWSQWSKGELTPIGMSQHYNQGLRLKARYIDQYKFINSTYRRDEIYVRSAYSPRCIQSAAANLAGFYSASTGTFPTNTPGYPANWTPVPIHTLENGPQRHLLDAGDDCDRCDLLMAARTDNDQFLLYEKSNFPMVVEISVHTGDPLYDTKGIGRFYDCIRVEKEYYNMTLPSWITPQLYSQLEEMNFRTSDYESGQADFGVGDNVELIRTQGGMLLTEMVNRMMERQNGGGQKMYIYSAHDSTMNVLLMTLGAKAAVVGPLNPDYAAMFALELWKTSTNNFYIKAAYSANQYSEFQVVTREIRDCGGTDQCDFQVFYNGSTPYFVKNIIELCDTP